MNDKLSNLLKQADIVFRENFASEAWFGRCIFLSWYCDLGTCTFCFRSTTKHKIKHSSMARRSMASILTDAVLGKYLGWKIEFLTGGYKIFSFEEIVEIAKYVSEIYEEKIWVNLGVLTNEELEQLSPYVEGVCASIETVNLELHKKVCPDKDIAPYVDFLKRAKNFKKSMTMIIGLGETKDDVELLFDFIEENNLDQITFYALKPVRETPFTVSPDPEYYAWWIAKTRIRFPKLKIMCGLTPKNPNYTELLLKAGANSITKFPALKQFGSDNAKLIESMAKKANKKFLGSLTKVPNVNWDEEIDKLSFDKELKEEVKVKIHQYLKKMS